MGCNYLAVLWMHYFWFDLFCSFKWLLWEGHNACKLFKWRGRINARSSLWENEDGNMYQFQYGPKLFQVNNFILWQQELFSLISTEIAFFNKHHQTRPYICSDVLPIMDTLCSGRLSCEVQVFVAFLHLPQPCSGEFRSYLEASFTCISGRLLKVQICTPAFYCFWYYNHPNCTHSSIAFWEMENW